MIPHIHIYKRRGAFILHSKRMQKDNGGRALYGTWHTWREHIHSRATRARQHSQEDLGGNGGAHGDTAYLNYLSNQQQINTSFIMANQCSISASYLMYDG